MVGWMEGQIAEGQDKAEINKEMRLLWLLWVANLSTLFVLILICHTLGARIKENMNVREDFPLGILKIVFGIVGLLSLAFAQFLRKQFLAGKIKLFEKQCIRSAALMNKPLYLLKYRTNIFLPMMIPAITGMFGFLLFFFGAGFETLYVFVIVSALGMLWQRPKTEELIEFFHREKTKERTE